MLFILVWFDVSSLFWPNNGNMFEHKVINTTNPNYHNYTWILFLSSFKLSYFPSSQVPILLQAKLVPKYPVPTPNLHNVKAIKIF